MKIKKLLYFLGPLLVLSLSLYSLGWAQSKRATKAPIITHSFAIEKGYYGYIWKVYIEAEDPDGDMFKVASVVDQTAWGHYPTDWIILKPQFRHHVKGYLQWNTFSSQAPYLQEWTNITLRVSIFDKAGNESNEVVFPFTFVSGAVAPYQAPVPFNQGDVPRLGYVMIDLFEPSLSGFVGPPDPPL